MLTRDEVLGLSKEATDLGAKIVFALTSGSDGGKKITKTERKTLGKLALALAKHLLVDVMD